LHNLCILENDDWIAPIDDDHHEFIYNALLNQNDENDFANVRNRVKHQMQQWLHN
jgi:hypothetical protein